MHAVFGWLSHWLGLTIATGYPRRSRYLGNGVWQIYHTVRCYKCSAKWLVPSYKTTDRDLAEWCGPKGAPR